MIFSQSYQRGFDHLILSFYSFYFNFLSNFREQTSMFYNFIYLCFINFSLIFHFTLLYYYYFSIQLPSLPIIHHHCKNLTNQLLAHQIQILMILLYSVASCYCQSLRKIHVRIESLLRINFESIFQSHTAYYIYIIYKRNMLIVAVFF